MKLMAHKERRCIMPASGFFEWTGDKSNRKPHLFTAADGSPALVAIDCGGSRWMEIYHDRMMVILDEKDFGVWLDGSVGPEALTSPSETALREWPVSKRLNKTGEGDDDSTVIEPLPAPAQSNGQS